jgi:hypothetical protein
LDSASFWSLASSGGCIDTDSRTKDASAAPATPSMEALVRPWGGGHLQRRHRQLLRIHRNQTVDLIFQDHRASHGGIGAPRHNLEAFCFIMVGPSSGGAAEGMSLFVMVKVCKKALEKMWFPMK